MVSKATTIVVLTGTDAQIVRPYTGLLVSLDHHGRLLARHYPCVTTTVTRLVVRGYCPSDRRLRCVGPLRGPFAVAVMKMLEMERLKGGGFLIIQRGMR